MAQKPVIAAPTEINPLFSIPPGAIDAIYQESGIFSPDDDTDDSVDTSQSQVIPVPTGLRIVSQAMRTTKSGQEVVDVTLEVDDIKGVSQYDLRVTPIS